MEYTAVDATGFGVEGSEPLSLLTHVDLDVLLPESRPTEAGVVAWSPPTPNWNPWTGANIDEGRCFFKDYLPTLTFLHKEFCHQKILYQLGNISFTKNEKKSIQNQSL